MQAVHLAFNPELLQDLEIMERAAGNGSVFDACNFTKTYGGRAKLQEKFLQPLADRKRITQVQDALNFLMANRHSVGLPFSQELLHFLEQYRESSIAPISQGKPVLALLEGLKYKWVYQRDYEFIVRSTYRFLGFMHQLQRWIKPLAMLTSPPVLQYLIQKVIKALETPALREIDHSGGKSLFFYQLLHIDWLIRIKAREEIAQLLECIYEWDALLSMTKAVETHELVFPEWVSTPEPMVHLQGVRHLLLDKPVPNDLLLGANKKLLLLTGPNMAGKTTYLKACGVAVYLAHLGLGVPASGATLSVFEALFSSIQTTDNISAGYSYFFSEVVKTRQLAEVVRSRKKIFVIADELFKGTNVKDAFDCSETVISGLLNWSNGIYVVSTHFTELASVYREVKEVTFSYFESSVKDGKPVFSYHLAEGVSHERLGMLILQNEGVPYLLTRLNQ